MPDEMVVDLSRPSPQAVVRAMSPADAAELANSQGTSLAQQQTEDTRRQQIRTALFNLMQSPSVVAFMQDPSPTGASTVATLKEVIPALKATIRALAREMG